MATRDRHGSFVDLIALIQMLWNVEGFANLLLAISPSPEMAVDPVVGLLQEIVVHTSQHKSDCVDILFRFVGALGMGRNEDIQEITHFLLAKLRDDRCYPQIAQFVLKYFFFYQTILMNGKRTSDSGQPCTIVLNIDKCQQLEGYLDHFCAEDELTTKGENELQWEQRKMVTLDTLPGVLIFYLSRFDPNKLGQIAKIQSIITFPSAIDIRRWIPAPSERQLIYDLTSVAKHRGMEIHNGHYIVLCIINGEWRTFHDREVYPTDSLMDAATILVGTTVMLFYELIHVEES
jgi:uncharacterized UBP type Zn finger protein